MIFSEFAQKKSPKLLIIVISMSSVLCLFPNHSSAGSKWVPTFDDKPVSDREIEEVHEALPAGPVVRPLEPRRVLVYSATQGFRHDSIPIGKVALEAMGEKTGAYTAVVSDDPANFEREALEQFDAVILLSPTQDFFMPSKKQRDQFSNNEWKELEERQVRLVDNLTNYVENGGGIMGIHAATDACYEQEEYGEMMGAYFESHPWTRNMKVTIVVEDPDHATMRPVFGESPNFEIVDEIYKFRQEPYSRDRLRILLHLDPERSDKPKREVDMDGDYAVAWVQSVGEGRVFYSSIGHNKHIYKDPLMMKHYLAGIQFATGDLKADTTPSTELER